MSKVVRGKFTVTEVSKYHYSPDAANIKLAAIYTGSEEDNTFSRATPQAEITMHVSNPAAVQALALGKSFYVDFTPVEEQ